MISLENGTLDSIVRQVTTTSISSAVELQTTSTVAPRRIKWYRRKWKGKRYKTNDILIDDLDLVQDNVDAGLHVGSVDSLLDGDHGRVSGVSLVSCLQEEEGHQTQE